MKRVSCTELRQNLAECLDAVCDSHTPLLVKRRAGRSVVMLSLSEYRSMEETLHLLSDPANADHLRRSIAQAETGQFIERDIVE